MEQRAQMQDPIRLWNPQNLMEMCRLSGRDGINMTHGFYSQVVRDYVLHQMRKQICEEGEFSF